MKLTGIEIKNFKGINEEGIYIDIKPLTILCGATLEDEGKDTLSEAFLLLNKILIQNKLALASSINDNNILNLDCIEELGSFKDYVYKHDTNRKLSLKIFFDECNKQVDYYERIDCVKSFAIEFELAWNDFAEFSFLDNYKIFINNKLFTIAEPNEDLSFEAEKSVFTYKYLSFEPFLEEETYKEIIENIDNYTIAGIEDKLLAIDENFKDFFPYMKLENFFYLNGKDKESNKILEYPICYKDYTFMFPIFGEDKDYVSEVFKAEDCISLAQSFILKDRFPKPTFLKSTFAKFIFADLPEILDSYRFISYLAQDKSEKGFTETFCELINTNSNTVKLVIDFDKYNRAEDNAQLSLANSIYNITLENNSKYFAKYLSSKKNTKKHSLEPSIIILEIDNIDFYKKVINAIEETKSYTMSLLKLNNYNKTVYKEVNKEVKNSLVYNLSCPIEALEKDKIESVTIPLEDIIALNSISTNIEGDIICEKTSIIDEIKSEIKFMEVVKMTKQSKIC